jgi:hypothetical protein
LACDPGNPECIDILKEYLIGRHFKIYTKIPLVVLLVMDSRNFALLFFFASIAQCHFVL